MSLTAQLADGRTLVFPDDTDPDVIQQTVKRTLGLPLDNGDSALQRLAQSFPMPEGKPDATLAEAIQAGMKHSVFGTVESRGEQEQQQKDFNWYQRAASNVTTLLADAPFLVFGALGGSAAGTAVAPGIGTVVGAGAGAFALPEAMRQTLIEGYGKGWFKDWGDFWTRFMAAGLQTGKSAALGAVIGPAGTVGKALVPAAAPAIAKTTAQLASEVTAMSGLGAAMDGRVPSAQDFLDNAILLGGAKLAIKGASVAHEKIALKLGKVYEKTGMTPEQVAEEAGRDPTIIQDLASENIEVPKSLGGKTGVPPESVEAKEAQETGKPPEPPKPPESDELGLGEPKRTEAEKAVLSRIVEHPEKPKMTVMERLHSWYNEIFDERHRIMQAQREAGVKKGELGPYEIARLTAGIAGKSAQFIEFGPFDARTYEQTGMSYKAVLDQVKNDPKGFKAYTVSKHTLEREAAGKATGIDLTAAKQVVTDGASRFEKASTERVKFKDAVLDYGVKSGLIPQEAVSAWRELYKAHVPFYRLFEGEERPASGRTPRNPVKKATGSERLILDPIESDIRDTYLMISLAEQNMARQEFVKLGAQFAEKVKHPLLPIRLQDTEIKKLFDDLLTIKKKTSKERTEQTTTTGPGGEVKPDNKIFAANTKRVHDALTARGFSENEADIMIKRVGMAEGKEGSTTIERIVKEIEKTEYIPELDTRIPTDAAIVFRALAAPAGKNEIVVMQEGKRQVYTVDSDVARAFNGLDAGGASFVAQVLRTTASWLRSGVTLSPDFIMRNPVRDAVTAFVTVGAHPIKTVKGAISYFKEDVAYQNWLKGGGANAAMVSMDRHYIERHIYELEKQTGFMDKAWNLAKSPFEVLAIVSETMENVTRLGMVRDEIMVAKDKATIQALSYISREGTIDFSRHGADSFLQSWTRATAFMNPAMQGMDRMVRAFKDNPAGTTARALAAVTLPSLLLWWRNHDDPRWKDIPDWQRDLFWIVLTDKWERPQNTDEMAEKHALGLTREINGEIMVNNGNTYRIPKPFELGVLFGSLPERMLDAYVAANPDAFKNFYKTLGNVFAFNVIPTVFLPPFQQLTNYNMFTDRPLIPDSMQGILPEYQYTPYTTETTKALGQLVGSMPGLHDSSFASPIVIDNYIRGWSGTLGSYVVQIADAALRKTGALPDPVMPARTLADMPGIRAFVVRYPDGQAQSIQDFYDNYDKSSKVWQTVRRLARAGDIEHAQKEMLLGQEDVLKLDAIRVALGNGTRFIQLIHQNQQLDADEKRQLIDTSYAQMILQAKTGNHIMRGLKEAMRSLETVQ